jgi:hypothetical protein
MQWMIKCMHKALRIGYKVEQKKIKESHAL